MCWLMPTTRSLRTTSESWPRRAAALAGRDHHYGDPADREACRAVSPSAPAIPLAAPPSVLRRYDTVHRRAAQAVPRGPLFGSGRTAFAGWGFYGLKIPGTPPGRGIAHDAPRLRLGLNNRPVRPSDDATRDLVKRPGHGHFPSSNERKIRMLVRRRQTWLTMA